MSWFLREAEVRYRKGKRVEDVGRRVGGSADVDTLVHDADEELRCASAVDERMIALALDGRNRVLGWHLVGKGGATTCIVEPTAVWRALVMMGALGVRQQRRVAKPGGKFKLRRMSLHERLEDFRQLPQRQDLGDRLLALKWIGNEGAHDSRLERRDLLDALEILDSALHRISGAAARTDRLTKEALARRGKPASAKRTHR